VALQRGHASFRSGWNRHAIDHCRLRRGDLGARPLGAYLSILVSAPSHTALELAFAHLKPRVNNTISAEIGGPVAHAANAFPA